MRSARNLLVACFLAAGCYVEGYVPTPVVAADGGAELVEISPGVEVVADWGAPIFFVDDYYWWNVGGFWYRSHWYRDGWARAPYVPWRVAGITHPEGYVHYRPQGWVARGAIRQGRALGEYRAAPMRGGGVHSRPAPRGGGNRR